jgi:N-acetylglucosamine malate deacetylase 1
MSVTYDLVAFGAHPDDVEIFCGGTIIKMVEKGYRVAIVDLTEGEMGTRGSREIRAEEARAAQAVMGVHHRENLGIPDTQVLVNLENRDLVIEVIRRLRPRAVITSYWEGRHPDHGNGSRLVYDACFFGGLKNYPLPGEAFRPHKLFYTIRHREYMQPSFVTDITGQFKTKLEAVRAYRSQFPDSTDEERFTPHYITERLRDFASFCGTHIGRKYGEAFFIKEAIEIDDPLAMTVPSL